MFCCGIDLYQYIGSLIPSSTQSPKMGNYNPGCSKTSHQHHHHIAGATSRAATRVARGGNRLLSSKCSSTNSSCQHKHNHNHYQNQHHSKSTCRGIDNTHRSSHQALWSPEQDAIQRHDTTDYVIGNFISSPTHDNMTMGSINHHDDHMMITNNDRYASINDSTARDGTLSRRTTKHNNSQIPLTKSKLPSGYTKRQTSQGQVFFVDSHGQKYWYDPSVPRELLNASLNLDELVGKLSSTWEIKQAPSGKIYYVNHIKKTTQFTDPRLVAYREYLMSIMATLNHNSSAMSATSLAAPTTPTTTTTLPNHNNRSLHLSPAALVAQQSQSQSLSTTRESDESVAGRHGHPGGPNSLIYSLHLERERNVRELMSSKPRPPVVYASPNQNTTIYSTRSDDNLPQATATTTTIDNNKKPFATSAITNVNIDSKLLSDKISILRQELVKRQVVALTCKIDIRRRKIFEESFRIISQMSPRDLKKRLNVRFRGEEGVDFGGVAREWFYLLSREMLNPVHGLFQYTSSDIYNLQINPDSGIVYSEHLSYMHFCGRIIGMAVFHGHFTEGHFTLPFYKMLLRKPITLDDIEFVDPELHRGLCWMLENDITDALDTTFLVEHNAFGQLQEHELKENGKEIAVTEKNKHEYVSLYVNYRCRRGIEKQYEALQRGFDELIEPPLLQSFNEHELELLIGGLSKINVDDWKSNTKLKNCTTETALVKWFWDIVKTHYNEDKRAQLLQFVTGSPRVPIQGFKALRGVEAELRPFTIHLIRNGSTNDLPKSHTCFNRLDLPPYETYDKLRDKLTQAIEETMGFAMQ